jgi:hypothetical protein
VIDVVAVVGGVAVMLHQETRLAVGEQELDALVLVLGFAEAGELEDPPGLGAVAGGVCAAVERRRTRRCIHDATMLRRNVFCRVERLQRNAGDSVPASGA